MNKRNSAQIFIDSSGILKNFEKSKGLKG